MRRHRTAMTTCFGALLLVLGTGCDDGGGATRFRGTYTVPTVGPDLAAAATYDVPEVEWRVDGDTVTLDYDLPMGLVGKKVNVRFTGPIEGAAASLSGAPGTATCDVGSASVSCHEIMKGLLPLDPDYATIESIAAAEYKGPVQDRLDVAKSFSLDPIGVVNIDVSAPAGDDGVK